MKKTIKEKVQEAKDILQLYTTSQELREWGIINGMDSAVGFSNFKKALIEIGIDYDYWKRNGKPAGIINLIQDGEVNFVEVEKFPLELIAEYIYGNLWIKGDKRRIYVTGGNNYHYEGKWHIEFDDDGDFEIKCWLNQGYSNKKSEQYMKKHIRQIEESVQNAMKELGIQKENLAIFELPEHKEKRIKREKEIQEEIEKKCQAVRELITIQLVEDRVFQTINNNEEIPW